MFCSSESRCFLARCFFFFFDTVRSWKTKKVLESRWLLSPSYLYEPCYSAAAICFKTLFVSLPSFGVLFSFRWSENADVSQSIDFILNCLFVALFHFWQSWRIMSGWSKVYFSMAKTSFADSVNEIFQTLHDNLHWAVLKFHTSLCGLDLTST